MATEMNLWNRLQGQTPKFFKRVINIAVSLSAIGTVLVTVEATVPGFHLPETMLHISQWMIVAGLAAAAVGKTTVTTPTNNQPYTAPNDDEVNNK